MGRKLAVWALHFYEVITQELHSQTLVVQTTIIFEFLGEIYAAVHGQNLPPTVINQSKEAYAGERAASPTQ